MILVAFVVVIISGIGVVASGFLSAPVCGDGVCGVNENQAKCPEDCSGVCGDGYCHPLDENVNSCPQDCSEEAVCGDELCELGEDVNNCPQDCTGTCGDGYCHATEKQNPICESDCLPNCGNGICETVTLPDPGAPMNENEVVCPSDCQESPVTDLMDICTEEEMKSYVLNYEGTDDQLIQEFEAACAAFGTDLDGCPVELDYSTFGITTQPDGRDLGWADCVSVCEWDEEGRAKSGHVLFTVMWWATEPRSIDYEPRIGAFSARSQCGWTGLWWIPWYSPLEVRVF